MRVFLPKREQWLAIGFLSIFAYVFTFGEGTPCTTYHYRWLGESITWITIGLSVWVVIDMVADWVWFWRFRKAAS